MAIVNVNTNIVKVIATSQNGSTVTVIAGRAFKVDLADGDVTLPKLAQDVINLIEDSGIPDVSGTTPKARIEGSWVDVPASSLADGNKGDLTVTGDDWELNDGVVTEAKLSSGVNAKIDGAVSGYKGTIYIADTPTLDGYYTPMESGTYTNAGGLVYSPTTTDLGKSVTFIKTGASWVKNSVPFINDLVLTQVYDGSILNIDGFIRAVGTESTSNAYKKSDFIDVSTFLDLEVTTKLTAPASSVVVAFYNASNVFISAYSTALNTLQSYTVSIPATTKFARFCCNTVDVSLFKIKTTITKFDNLNKRIDSVIVNTNLSPKVYVSLTGSNVTGTGTTLLPFASYTKAKSVLRQGGVIVFKGGDYIFSSVFDINTNVKAESGQRVRFLFGTRITSATLEVGYTKVYSTTYAPTINSTYYLWQHDIADEATLISAIKRHPFHNGKTHRLGSTRIYNAASLAEIESTTDKLMWYKSGTKLYFSKALASDLSVNSIFIPDAYTVMLQEDVQVNNIKIMYAPLNINKTKSTLRNVSVGFVNGVGSMRFDDSIGVNFERCEFYACNNDGANGHSATPTNIFANTTEAVFKDCWFHDNTDDGESCHEYSQAIHYGSLVEFNGNGITPASGAHTVCHNSTVRDSGVHPWSLGQPGTAFSAQGSPLDGGASTDIWCYNCVSENNGVGFTAQNAGNTFVNCISKGDTVAFSGTSNQINCITIP